MENFFKSIGLDQYQRTAQLPPAVLAIWPATATAFMWAPAAAHLVAGLSNVVVSIGVLYFLMNVGRTKGRAVQDDLVRKWGGLPTTLALRHRDGHISRTLRTRYHDGLKKHDFVMPTLEQETEDPEGADDVYRAVSEWIPGQTRDAKCFPLVHIENRNYGLCRNLFGLKPIGLTVAIIFSIVNGLCLYMSWISHGAIASGLLLEGLFLTSILSWATLVNENLVEATSWAYAKQALASIEKLPKKARSSSQR